ncbi:dipeptidase [Herbiconiux sp. L3-i23]|uniref:dipeptidase n=1 Tax=Herbiconiux sp. L3-i23 TaxID=2905871 RepID=UPI0020473CE3|nr:dipeptidase [Herbiconiux sp. L3-i23]BDI22422.1 dipeptidase [Herbiconiux sp. L3-i23]
MASEPQGPAPTTPESNGSDGRESALRATVDAAFPATVKDLSALVRIPSVSWDGFDGANVRASADAVAELARGIGLFDTVDVVSVPIAPGSDVSGQPAVLAHRAAKNGAPTVLLYAHHDVQPPGDESLWESAPYEPTVRGDRLYGRGASDDKAGVITHIAALRALAENRGDDLDLGIVLFNEGEEEFGSRSFGNFLDIHREVLDADVIVVADSDNWDTATPALTVSLRGNVAFNLTVSTLDHASHSGMFGGAAPDAMLAAIKLLATLWDEDGVVAVDGLESYTSTEAPQYDSAQFRDEAALLDGVTPIGGDADIYSKMWFRPSITVTGIDAPTVQNASNTLVPSVRVRISTRIAPGQKAADAYGALRRHLDARAPLGAVLDYSDPDLGEPFLVDTTGDAFTLASQALADGWGAATVEQGVGGSIPFIAQLAETFPGAQILVTGVEDPDTRAHSPNESQHLGVLKRAITGEALLLSRLADKR